MILGNNPWKYTPKVFFQGIYDRGIFLDTKKYVSIREQLVKIVSQTITTWLSIL